MGSGRLGCPHRSSRPLCRQERHARPHATRPLASVYNGRLSVYRDLTRNRPDERCLSPRPTCVDSQRPGEEVCVWPPWLNGIPITHATKSPIPVPRSSGPKAEWSAGCASGQWRPYGT